MSRDHTFTLPVFQGPLDLLLHLIKTNELEITEISISHITGQYLDYLRLMETLDLEVAGDYLVMAATLINIKLRSLLPADEDQPEEETEEFDDFMSARALMQRLVEYRQFKEAAADLSRRAEQQAEIFYREVALPQLAEAEATPAVRGDLDKLLDAFSRVIRFVERKDYHAVRGEEYSVDDKTAMIRRRLLLAERLELGALFRECEDKVEMVVTLLAMLELCRLKEVFLRQGENFEEVYVLRREGAGRPDAEQVAAESEQLERIEQEIIAGRTGVLDDGIIPGESDDLPVADSIPDQNPNENPAGSTNGSPEASARIIDFEADPGGESQSDPGDRNPAP